MKRGRSAGYLADMQPEQRIIAKWLETTRERLGWSWASWAEKAGLGAATTLTRAVKEDYASVTGIPTLHALAKAANIPSVLDFLASNLDASRVAPPEPANDDDTVEVEQIDLAFGLGSTYTDTGALESTPLKFPRRWLETITSSSIGLLTWARGRGDSMHPTIDDGDLILLDRSQTKVREQDAMWAFTVGDTASIKRLRVKGDRYQILSDNPSVPPDEEPIDFVRIWARVVFVGKRK
ncbi:S24 family peptidase [Sphingomonas naphthae]|uniref:S24 family peptidase n=1 Tax=Sphingomonas naphthae TaxID=1813468 RepID=A0ABY7TL67_9SPHN|nr:S24 family peptidase [Sphingomonas naphthae]WCT73955.1 S24 family peptidase [Sphingomonas naphthae]